MQPGLTIGIDGLPDDEAIPILKELYAHQSRPEYCHRHKWSQDMRAAHVDNRSVIHAATGGYEGHRRPLHRITVADGTLQ
jgi:taurine dioxygenase